MDTQTEEYSIWIEAECWEDGWESDDVNSDAIVTFEDGKRWVATFFTYKNIRSLTEKFRRSGECLGGKYFVATDMILVDEVTRVRIEEVVADLIKENEFEIYFERCDE
jgi:hypothetical protein